MVVFETSSSAGKKRLLRLQKTRYFNAVYGRSSGGKNPRAENTGGFNFKEYFLAAQQKEQKFKNNLLQEIKNERLLNVMNKLKNPSRRTAFTEFENPSWTPTGFPTFITGKSAKAEGWLRIIGKTKGFFGWAGRKAVNVLEEQRGQYKRELWESETAGQSLQNQSEGYKMARNMFKEGDISAEDYGSFVSNVGTRPQVFYEPPPSSSAILVPSQSAPSIFGQQPFSSGTNTMGGITEVLKASAIPLLIIGGIVLLSSFRKR